MVSATIANVNRTAEQRVYLPHDFLPWLGDFMRPRPVTELPVEEDGLSDGPTEEDVAALEAMLERL